MIGIRYVGKKDEHTDNRYGTGLTWLPDQVHNVDDAAAKKMLEHTDTYAEEAALPADKAPAKTPEQVAEGKADEQAKKDDQQREDDARRDAPPQVDLGQLDKKGLQDYSLRYFNEKLPATLKEDTMRSRIMAFANRKQ